MKRFPYAHATHPQWPVAAALVVAQLRGQMAQPGYATSPTLGLLYITDVYAAQAKAILDYLAAELPLLTDWSGTVGVGIAATGVEYWSEPAMAVMLLDVPSDQYRVFSGVAPLPMGFEAHTALVHADGATPDMAELVQELALRTEGRSLFGGLSSSRTEHVQFALAADGNVRGQGAAGGVFQGGLSGVAFAAGVRIASRISQGCTPVSKVRTVTEAQHNLVLALDGAPALDLMLEDLGVTLAQPQAALEKVAASVVAMGDAAQVLVHATGNLGSAAMVRPIVGLDALRHGVAVGAVVSPGAQLAFCVRSKDAARADLVRTCAEIREELESLNAPVPVVPAQAPAPDLSPQRIAGAVYISCVGRGGEHFGAANAELQILRRALGDIPLVGFFAGGEIALNRIYGYSGVLAVFG